MTVFRSHRIPLALAAVLALTAAGCGSGNGDGSAARTEGGATAGTDPAVETAGDLRTLLGPAFEAAEVRLDAAVDRCLTDQGLPPLADHAPVDFGPPAPGFGVTTTFGELPDGSPTDTATDAPVDPSDEEMTSAQLVALFGGPGGDDDPALGWGSGCFGSAAQEVYGDADAYLDLEEALDDLTEAVDRDPRRRPALAAWRACMRDQAGVTPDDPESLVAAFAEEVAAELYVAGEPEPVEYPAPDETVAGTPAGEFRDGVDRAAVAARQAEEERLAGAAVACGEAHLDSVEATIRTDLEARFMHQHRDLLDRLDLGRFLR